MADVKNRIAAADRGVGDDTDRRNRGQLLLITALALTVILVTVALLLNAAIFTENVATRDTTADGAEAIEFRIELVDAVGGLIETENWRNDGQTDDVEAAINATTPLVDRQHARYGTVAGVSLNGTPRSGRLLRWNGGTPFTDDGGNADWELVDGLDDSRNFTLDVDPDSLATASAATSDNDAFGVRFNRSGGTVTQYIYTDGSGGLAVAQAVDGGTPHRQCRIAHGGATTTVDLTGDRLSTADSDTECFRGLWPDDPPEAIEFVSGTAAAGTFAVTVDDSASPTTDPAVLNEPAVYSATVDVVYQTPDLEFETTVEIAPGEPR